MLTFISTHDLIRAEEILVAEGYKLKILPLPQRIEAGCSLGLEVYSGSADSLEELLTAQGLKLKGIYHQRESGWQG